MTRGSSNKYKTYTLALLLITAAALLVCAAALASKRSAALQVQGSPRETYESYYSLNPAPSQEMEKEAAASQISPPKDSPSSEGPQETYLVTVYEGKIGVFQLGKTTPFLTADVDVYLLPEKDLELLKKGFRAKSLSEVRGILEDYE